MSVSTEKKQQDWARAEEPMRNWTYCLMLKTITRAVHTDSDFYWFFFFFGTEKVCIYIAALHNACYKQDDLKHINQNHLEYGWFFIYPFVDINLINIKTFIKYYKILNNLIKFLIINLI